MNRALLFVVAAAATFTGFALSPDKRPTLPPRPPFELPVVNGAARSIAEFDGQVVLLNFWAPWCPPCREEIPDFVSLQARYGSRGLAVVGLAVDSEANIRRFLAESAVNYPIFLAERSGIELAAAYGNDIGALPFTVVIDRHGKIVARYFRKLTLAEAEAAIKPLL